MVIVADKSAIGHDNCVQDLECRNCHGDFSGRCVQDFILIVRLSVVFVPKSCNIDDTVYGWRKDASIISRSVT